MYKKVREIKRYTIPVIKQVILEDVMYGKENTVYNSAIILYADGR